MEFTYSLFQRRLSHILTLTADRKTAHAGTGKSPAPVALRSSRRGPAPASSRIASLTRGVDELVLDYARDHIHNPGQPLPMVAVDELDGHVLWGPASDWKLVCHYLICGGLDPGLAHFFRRNIKPGGVFMDIGASLGAYTILAALLTGNEGVVYSFEGSQAYSWLVRNLHESGLGGGEHVRAKQLLVGKAPSTVDHLVASGERVDFLRIGGHYPVLDVLGGMQRVCRDNSDCRIVIDYCSALQPHGANLLSMLDVIENMGFSLQGIDSPTGEVGTLDRDRAKDAFSVNLLLEQSREMRWSR